jgi:chromosome partitioning protein
MGWMILLAVANQKGGVAKTNLTGNLGAEFAALGKRVVLVDLDPQATLTTWLLGRTNAPGTAEIFMDESAAADVLIEVQAFGLSLMPAVPDRLRVAERTLSAQVGSERRLGKALRQLEADVIVMDCPPSMGILTASALVAATSGVIIPLAAAPEALDGYVQVTANLQRLRDALDLPIPIVAVVPTRVDQRLRIARDVLDAARELCNGTMTSSIRENVALRELFGHRQPIRTYRPDSTGAADYAAVATEVLQRV